MTGHVLAAGAHAFGDGSHPTTRGVLELLANINPQIFRPHGALDIGAGSGILSFAILEKFGCPVVAVDVEASAVETINTNVRSNGVMGLTALRADGFNHPEIRARSPYDLITMNILAEPLLKLAHEAEAHLAAQGLLILSGILLWQEEQIREAYRGLGLELSARVVIGDWVSLAWQKA